MRLEKKLLKEFDFFCLIHGHNHRFSYQNTSTPEINFRIRRISVPTLSDRNKRWERGYLIWNLLPKGQQEEPRLCVLKDDESEDAIEGAEDNNKDKPDENAIIRALLTKWKEERVHDERH